MSGPGIFQNRHWVLGLILAVLLFGGTVKSQTKLKVYAGLGLNTSYMPLDSLNWIIDQYNERQPNIEKSLGNIHTPLGINGQLGVVFNRLIIDLSYTGRMLGVKSRENEQANGTYFVRQLRFRANTFDIGFGVRLAESENAMFSMGASVDFGAVKVFTRYARNDQVGTIPINSPVMNELTLGNTVYAQGLINIGLNNPLYLYFRPYFQWAWNKNDFQPVNRTLNNQTYLDDPQFILGLPYNVGLKIGIAFYGG